MATQQRCVTEGDAAALCAIYNPYVRDTVISFEQSPVSEAEMATRIRDTSAHYPWLVAEADGKVAAYAYATRWRTRAAYDWALESTVYVDKAYTGRGIANLNHAAHAQWWVVSRCPMTPVWRCTRNAAL